MFLASGRSHWRRPGAGTFIESNITVIPLYRRSGGYEAAGTTNHSRVKVGALPSEITVP